MANNCTDNVIVIDMKQNSHERCIWNTYVEEGSDVIENILDRASNLF